MSRALLGVLALCVIVAIGFVLSFVVFEVSGVWVAISGAVTGLSAAAACIAVAGGEL